MRNEAMAVSSMSTGRRWSLKSKWVVLALGGSVLLELVLGFALLGPGRAWWASQTSEGHSPADALVQRIASPRTSPLQISSVAVGPLSMSALPLERTGRVGRLQFAGLGTTYVQTHVILRNQGTLPLDYDPSSFLLIDATHQSRAVDPVGMGATPGAMTSGTLAPDATGQGYLVFHVPSHVQGLTLTYQPSDRPGGSPPIRVGSE